MGEGPQDPLTRQLHSIGLQPCHIAAADAGQLSELCVGDALGTAQFIDALP